MNFITEMKFCFEEKCIFLTKRISQPQNVGPNSFKQMPEQYLNYATNASFQILRTSSIINHPATRRHAVYLLTAPFNNRKITFKCRAVTQAVSRWLPTAAARVLMWGLWWTKWHWGTFSPRTSVSLANHSTNFSIIRIARGWHNRPIGGRSAEWTQLDSIPHYTNLIFKITFLLDMASCILLNCYQVSEEHAAYIFKVKE
jgi:hypothetical protein